MKVKEMTKEQLAELLNGSDGNLASWHERTAKENGLLVLFGAADDLLEMRGAINGEEDALWGGEYALLFKGEKYSYTDVDCRPQKADSIMLLPLSDEYDNDDNPRLIRAEWHPDDKPELNWRISSNMPCAPFTIKEEGEPDSEGIVIDLDEIKPLK